MKQFLFLSVMLLLGTFGTLFDPFWGILLYYSFAVLRPQYLWNWALPVEVRWSLIAAGVVLLGLAVNLPKVALHGRMNTVAWLVLGHSFFLLLSVLTAYDPTIAQTWGLEYAKIIIIALTATFVIDQIWKVKFVAAMMLLAVGYIAWEINYLYVFDGRLDIFNRGYGGLDNNGAGLMLAMGIPLAYVFGVTATSRWQRAASWLLGLFMIHGMLMSYSRGAMLSAIVGAAWLLIHHRPRFQAGIIVLAVCLAVPVLAGKEIRERFLTTKDYQTDGSANSRFASWSAAWQIATEHPLTGQGIRNSNEFIFNYGADKQGRTIHSQYLQIAADSGIPAMGLYAGVLGASLVFLTRARRTCREFLDSRAERPEPEAIDQEIAQTEKIALSLQASLAIFAFGGIFLSLEVFELPWILITVAGLLPACVWRRIEEFEEEAKLKATAKPQQRSGSPSKRKRRRPRSNTSLRGVPQP